MTKIDHLVEARRTLDHYKQCGVRSRELELIERIILYHESLRAPDVPPSGVLLGRVKIVPVDDLPTYGVDVEKLVKELISNAVTMIEARPTLNPLDWYHRVEFQLEKFEPIIKSHLRDFGRMLKVAKSIVENDKTEEFISHSDMEELKEALRQLGEDE